MAESMKNRAIAAELIARACRDSAFRRQFVADPKAALIAAGAEIGAAVEIRALESTDRLRYLVLPTQSGDAGDLTDAQLAGVAGGAGGAGTTAEPGAISVQSTNVSGEVQSMATQAVNGVEAVVVLV